MDEEQMSFFNVKPEGKAGRERVKTIISASRRTDIPAFYYDWLQESLKKGSAEVPNPMFPRKVYSVDLRPENVHSIVLWSKNFFNVAQNPGLLENYNLYFQYTINSYSRLLEPNVPEYKDTIHTLELLLKRYNPKCFNIRFDPVIISTKGEIYPDHDVPEKARLKAFEALCRDLKSLGMEECRVTTSYVSLYGHVKSRLKRSRLDFKDLNQDEEILFFSRMAEIADTYNLSLYSCACPVLEKVPGIRRGSCIDGALLEDLFGGKVKKSKDKGQRDECGCSYSRDIGIYKEDKNGMVCRHGCVYCYVMGKVTIVNAANSILLGDGSVNGII